jgi:hypothetical protein
VSAEADLRLAWWQRHIARQADCLALMSLAVAGAGNDVPWARRGFRWLVARVRNHPFAAFDSLATALDDPKLLAKLCKLRLTHPADKVAWQLLRADAIRGPFTSHRESIALIVDDLWPIHHNRHRIVQPAQLGLTRPETRHAKEASISA